MEIGKQFLVLKKMTFSIIWINVQLEVVKTATGMLEENMYTTNTFRIMKTNDIKIALAFIAWAIIASIGIILMCSSCTTSTASQLADSLIIYDEYYSTTEKLLNEIDEVHDWSTEYADNGKEENIGYYHIQYVLKDTKGMTIAETYKNLKTYYQETQELLQMLEEDYGWSDTVGEGDTYCEWVEVYKKIHK